MKDISNDTLSTNIILTGKSGKAPSIFDEIEETEAKLAENQDLYDAFDKILKVLETPSRYEEIQTVAPAMNVNTGQIRIDGVCLHDIKADAQSLNRGEDANTDDAMITNIVELYAKDLQAVIPDNLTVEHEFMDDNIKKMDKRRFVIIIKRKA